MQKRPPRDSHLRPRQWLAATLVGAGAVAFGACSSGSSPSAPAPAGARPETSSRPLATGTIASVGPSSMVVTDARTDSQVSVDWSAATTFHETVPASASDLTVGDCVQV